MSATPKRQPLLTLDPAIPTKEIPAIRDNFSAIALAGKHLWLGGDEGKLIDRMTVDGDGNFGQHQRFDLAAILSLPPGDGKEIDIEGLDVNGGYLWMTGSHSRKRKKADKDETPEDNRARLAEVSTIAKELNRHTLARIPLDSEGKPVKKNGALRAARLEHDVKGDQLTAAIRNDKHLQASCEIPSKENGLDVEGLAVTGNRVFLGLRGPVLRGWAVVLEFEWKDSVPGALALAGSLKKHFLQLEGLGVRELAIHGKDLYILAGPTMDLDGPVSIYRWPKALDNKKEALLWRKELEKVLDVPFGAGKSAGSDHAEGIALIANPSAPLETMVCYDSPAKGRLVETNPAQVRLDLFEIP